MIGEDFVAEVQEAHERALVDTVFEEIRKHTPTEAEREAAAPEWVEDPEAAKPNPDAVTLADEYPGGGCLRIDAEGRPISVEILRRAVHLFNRERNIDPEVEDFQFWTHDRLRDNLRGSMAHAHNAAMVNDMDMSVSVQGVPVLGMGYFPKASVLLLDPEAFTTVHQVGSTEERLAFTRPERVLRITGLSRDPPE